MTENKIPQKTERGLIEKLQTVYQEYPGQFWLVVGASFIDRLGGAMLFPFFTLYLTRKFGISMTTVGLIFGLFSLSGVIGTVVGGALTDRLGRKRMLLFGLVFSALTSVLMGVISELPLFLLATLLVGLLADAAGPAQQALVADLLPEDKRTSGFGILRVIFNLAVVIGPLIGGLLATQSYLLLFVADAITSLITAVIVFMVLQETWHPKLEEGEPPESIGQTFRAYLNVIQDHAFAWFLIASVLMALVYIQMNTTLAVYLRDVHGVNERGFSYILSLNAAMVVLFQFPITRRIEKYRPLLVITAGTLLYAVGFAMYGFFSTFSLFLAAMVIITIGEMLVSPVSQAIAARLAPENMRGRYMAVFEFSWMIPFMVGPLLAGLIFDNLKPEMLWYVSGILGLAAAGGYYLLELRVRSARYDYVEERIKILEQLEEGQITADTANTLLENVSQGTWARLAPEEALPAPRKMRIQVNDSASGLIKVDLRLPVGLINTVLDIGGNFSPDLDEVESAHLRELLALASEGNHHTTSEDHGMEITLE